ncbi:MAG: hypothetical protein QF464_13685, partial [Myxococcota bacterium]|nr:hypothetical protein [Myxococcota bacterium]
MGTDEASRRHLGSFSEGSVRVPMMDEKSKDKPQTEAMGSLEAPEAPRLASENLTQRESFGTDQTAPHQSVSDALAEMPVDRTLQATPTPIEARTTRREPNPALPATPSPA